MSTEGPGKLWGGGGRFSKPTERSVERFTSSIAVDIRLLTEDIVGSIAHARMLGRAQIIPVDDAASIVRGLVAVHGELSHALPVDLDRWEDVHSLVEGTLRPRVGEAAGRLHTARSRNDQVATDLRLYARRMLCDGAELLLDFQAACLELAERYPDTPMPGYTHLQRAQPVLFAHHCLAYAEMAGRDISRLLDAHTRASVLPLGSGALAGAPYPLDRPYVAELLGFDAISRNSLDAVSDRDFVVEHLAALALVAVHLSRLAEELVLWTSAEFGFARLDDAYATGSSIMPQKKNPDVAELVRGRTGRAVANLVGLLTVLKGLPLSYNRDLQEDKAGYFEAVEVVHACLRLTAEMLRTLEMRPDRLRDAAGGGFSTATDLADALVKRGLPFREAHGVAGAAVDLAESRGVPLWELDHASLVALHPFLQAMAPDLSVEASVTGRDVPGGTAPGRVAEARREARVRIAADRERVGALRQRLPTIESVQC
ncbi:MAG: argininosuccinate lyase [Chloroflexi bacterium]|nr:argininosuccinate lyase [Chloroflexota bacterium]